MTCRIGLMALLGSLGCSAGTERPGLASARTDTLPGGIISVTSPGPTAWTDTNGWKLVEAGRIGGELGTPGELINPQSLAMDGAGRVYVSDQSPAVIKVFEPDGSFIRTIGREGQGPGEFRVAFIAAQGGYLAVHDPRQSRTSLFDTTGAFLRSWTSTCCFYTSIAMDQDYLIHVPLMSPGDSIAIRFVRYDTLGAARDTIGVPRLNESPSWVLNNERGLPMMSMTVPYAPRTVYGISPLGGLIYGWSADYRLVRSSDGRDTTALFGRAWTPAPLPDERRRAAVERAVESQADNGDEVTLRNAFSIDLIPKELPAFTAILADALGNTWLLVDADSTHTRFDVFDSTGAWLGPVVAPLPVPVYGAVAWGRDVAYVSREDDDGFPYVARYRIVRSHR